MKVFAQNRTAAFDKRAVIKCAVAVALLVAASKVSFAIGPVPLTMQTFAVAVVGAWLGTRQGVAAVIAYLALGFAGLPVFATPLCGPAALMGPTAGYLVSFPMAAAISGLLAERGWTGKRVFASFISQYAANIFIVAFGALWLSASIGVEKAVLVGENRRNNHKNKILLLLQDRHGQISPVRLSLAAHLETRHKISWE